MQLGLMDIGCMSFAKSMLVDEEYRPIIAYPPRNQLQDDLIQMLAMFALNVVLYRSQAEYFSTEGSRLQRPPINPSRRKGLVTAKVFQPLNYQPFR
jgi:hypothetical protein